jgi:hypothetical protein
MHINMYEYVESCKDVASGLMVSSILIGMHIFIDI